MPAKDVIHSASMSAVHSIRHFNRFYTRQIGVLEEGLLHSPYSLTEVRVMFELAHRKQATATELVNELGLDGGYLSRILRSFDDHGLIVKKPSSTDKREVRLCLSPKGQQVFRPLEARAHREVAFLLRRLSLSQQKSLVRAMRTVEELLKPSPEPAVSYLLRPPRPGDMGWVVHRHGALYAQEYGWDDRFEALVAEIVAKFVQNFDPKVERCWIAEREDDIVGSVFLVKKSRNIAQLRLLLVEPSARGLGIGKRLVDECIQFARQAGYRTITLWTQSNLAAARGIYKSAGFQVVHRERHENFGYELESETWELAL